MFKRNPTSPLQQIIRIVLFAAVYYLFAHASLLINLPQTRFMLWLPAGVSLMAVLVGGWQMGIGVFLGVFLFRLGLLGETMNVLEVPITVTTAFVGAAAFACQSWVGAWLLQRWVQQLPPLTIADTIKAIVALAVVTLIAPLVQAADMLASAHIFTAPEFVEVVLRWWFPTFIGMAIFFPSMFMLWLRIGKEERVIQHFVWPLASFLVGLTLLVFYVVEENNQTRIATGLEADTQEIAHVLGDAVTFHDAQSIGALGALFVASDNVSREEFGAFSQEILGKYSFGNAFLWTPRVTAADRAAFEESVRDEKLPDFLIYELDANGNHVPAAERPEYFPVTFVELFASNRELAGWDINAEPEFEATLRQARASGEFAISPPFRLHHNERDLSILVVVPVYRHDAPTDSLQNRQNNLSGFAIGIYALNGIVDIGMDSIHANDLDLDIFLYDTTDPGDPQFLLYYDIASGENLQAEIPSLAAAQTGLYRSQTIPMGGRTWHLVARRPQIHSGHGTLVLVGGTVCRPGADLDVPCLCSIQPAYRGGYPTIRGKIPLPGREFPTGVVQHDSTRRIIYANQSAARIFGFDTPDELIRARSQTYVINPERYYQLFQNVLASGKVSNQELDILTTQGEKRNLLATASLNGEVVTSTLVDITERAQAQEEIEQLSRIVSQMEDMVVITDTQGVIEYVNPAFERVSGYTSAEAIGQTPRILKSGRHDSKFYSDLWATILRGEVFQAEITNRNKGGELYIVAKTISPVRDDQGNIVKFLATGKDITRRKAAEDLLAQQSEQMRLLYEASKQLNRSLDLQTTYQTICDAMSALVPINAMSIASYDEATKQIVCQAYWIDNQWLDVNLFPPIPLEEEGRGTQSRVIRSGRSLLFNDYQAYAQSAQTSYYVDSETNQVTPEDNLNEEDVTRSAMIAALKDGDKVTGVVQLMSYQLNAYTETQLQLLEALTLHIVSAEKNARLYAQVQAELQERKQTEEALRRKDAEYRLIAENTGDVIWILDWESQRFTYVSPSVEKLRGLTPEEVLTQPVSEALTPGSLQKLGALVSARLDDFVRTGTKATYTDPMDQYRKDGSVVQTEVSTTFVVNEEGKIQVVGISRDISERALAALQQETAYGIAQAAQNARSLQELYPQIHQKIGQVMYAENFYIALYDETTDTMTFDYSVDEKEKVRDGVYPVGTSFTSRVIRTGQTLLFRDTPELANLPRVGIPAAVWLGVPLRAEGKTIGVMAVQHYTDANVYSERDQRMLEFVSSQIATAIARKQSEEERDQQQRLLAHHYRLVEIINSISTRFINLPTEEIDAEIDRALQLLGEFEGVDRSYVFLFDDDHLLMNNTHEWCAPGVVPQIDSLKNIPIELFPWWVAQMERGDAVHIPVVAALPPEAQSLREVLEPQDIQSLLSVPLLRNRWLFGFVGFDMVQHSRTWDDDTVLLIKMLGDVISNALVRKKTEESVQRIERRNRALIENAPDAIVLLDDNGNFLFGSPSAARMFGYEMAELLGTPSTALMHPHDRYVALEIRKKYTETPSEVTTRSYRVRRKDGIYRWIEATYTNLLDEPAVNALVVNFRDITEQKAAEESLRRSEQRFATIFNSSPVGIALTRLNDNRITDINSAWTELWGYPREEVVERTAAEVGIWVDLNDRERLMGELLHRPRVLDFETLFRHKSGEVRNVSLSVEIVEIDGEQNLLIQIFDITERKQAQSLVEKSQASLEAAQATAHLGSWEHDPATGIGVWSKEMFNLFRLDPTQITPLLKDFMHFVHPADRQRLLDAERRAIESGEMVIVEYRTAPEYGDLRYFQASIQPVLDENRQLRHISGTVLDVTESRLLELTITERVKELTCLFNVSRLLDGADISLDLLCGQLLEYIPPAMQFPPLAVACVELDGKRIQTAGYNESLSSHCLCAQVLVHGNNRGQLRVFYTTDAPFVIPEEQSMLDNIALMLGLWIERKESESALRASDERFRQLADNIHEVFWMYDLVAQRIVYISPAYEGIWGRTCASLYADSREYLEGILPEDRHVMLAALEKQARGERTEMEYRVQKLDGTLRWVWDRSFPVFDENGVLIRQAGVATDITEVKNVQRELEDLNRDLEKRVEERTEEVRRSEATYRALFENSNDGIFLLTPDGSDLNANQKALDMLGYTLEEYQELTKNEVNAVAPPEQRAEADERFAAALRGDFVPLYERTFVGKGGKKVEVEINLSPVRDQSGNVIMVQSVVRDISERKQAEKLIRESSELFAEFMRHSPVYTYVKEVTPTSSAVVYCSDNFVEMIGVESEHMIGRDMTELFPFEFAQKIISDDWAVIASNQMHRLDEELNGRFYTTIKFPIAQGDKTLLAGYTIDITERKLAEEVLRDSRDKLSAANAALEKASRLKDEFLSSMSHELRTPLTGILGLAEALQMQTYGPLNEKHLRALRNIESSGRHLLDLINDILDLSKIEAGKLEIQFEQCSVVDVCQASLQLVKGMAHQKRQNIAFQIDPAITTVRADTRRLKQMLVNLLSNAVKFTPEGGGIGLDVERREADKTVVFTVWDKGIGIQPEDMGKLFKPFVQLDSSLARQYSGTGLGLSLVQRMAELQGGSIRVESVPGEGSRFSIVLPMAEYASQAKAITEQAGDPSRLKNALIIEDNILDIEHALLYLKELGLPGALQTTITGALERVAAMQPGAILLDLTLPDGSGMDLLAQIKSDARTSHIPVVIASVEERQIEAQRLGASGYLVKPFSQTELRAELSKAAALVQPNDQVLIIGARISRSTILMADDNELILETLGDFLQANGFNFVAARSGLELLDRVADILPDLVLVDIQMPGMDGMEAIRRLRASDNPRLSRVPIIAVTALAMTGDKERCIEAGANEYLSKPIVLQHLARRIHELLTQSNKAQNQ